MHPKANVLTGRKSRGVYISKLNMAYLKVSNLKSQLLPYFINSEFFLDFSALRFIVTIISNNINDDNNNNKDRLLRPG